MFMKKRINNFIIWISQLYTYYTQSQSNPSRKQNFYRNQQGDIKREIKWKIARQGKIIFKNNVFIFYCFYKRILLTFKFKKHQFSILKFQISKTCHVYTELKLRCCKKCIPFWKVQGRINFLVISSFWRLSPLLGLCPLPPFSKSETLNCYLNLFHSNTTPSLSLPPWVFLSTYYLECTQMIQNILHISRSK